MCVIDWELILEYLKVLLSWPPIAAVISVVFLVKFRQAISSKLGGMTNVTLPGMTASFVEQQNELESLGPIVLPGQVSETNPSTTAAPSEQVDVSTEVNREIQADALEYVPLGGNLETALDWAEKNPGPLVSDYLIANARLHFERCLNVIFGTQVLVLEYLAIDSKPHPLADLQTFYDRHLELLPNTTRTLYEYVGFLASFNLITNVGHADGPLYQINRQGEQFLRYIKQFYPTTWNLRGF